MNQDLLDRLEIKQLIDNWVVWRDAGHWDRFRTVWHDDGVMQATWTQGTADEFIAMSKAGWAKGVNILHFLGGNSIDLAGNRAISVWTVRGKGADGEDLNYQGCDIYTFRGGKIAAKDTYWKIVEQKDRL